MSSDSAEAFVKQLCNDADFAKKITSKIDKDNPQSRFSVIQESGFDFTDEQLQEALTTSPNATFSDDELDDRALEAVVGGVNIGSDPGKSRNYNLKIAGGSSLKLGFGFTGFDSRNKRGCATYW